MITKSYEKDLLSKYGFSVSGNYNSKYAILSPILKWSERQLFIERFKDYIAFILWLPLKHIYGGLPWDSIIGTVVRRLVILLDLYPNVNRVVVITPNNEELESLSEFHKEQIRNLYNVLTNKNIIIENYEKISKRGRFEKYNIRKDKVENLLDKIDVIKKSYTSRDLEEIKSEMLKQFNNLQIDLRYENHEFLIHPTGQSYQLRLKPEFSKIDDIYKYAECRLFQEGEIRPDRHGLLRVELNDKFYCSLKWSKDTLEDLKTFLQDKGIDYIKIEDTEFYNQVKKRLDQYVSDFTHVINSYNTLVYSSILPFYDIEYVGFGSTQLGWIYSYPRIIRKEDNKLLLKMVHNLRSVDVHDGLPYNLLFCIEFSLEFINSINEKANFLAELKYIDIYIDFLHAYYDNLPKRERVITQ